VVLKDLVTFGPCYEVFIADGKPAANIAAGHFSLGHLVLVLDKLIAGHEGLNCTSGTGSLAGKPLM
jgi:hypothetical protein